MTFVCFVLNIMYFTFGFSAVGTSSQALQMELQSSKHRLERIYVFCAVSSSHPRLNWRTTLWPTQGTSPFIVNCAVSVSLIVLIWGDISESTQGNALFIVVCATSSSLTMAHWRLTSGSTRTRRSSAQNAAKYFLLTGILRSIAAYTQGRSPTIALCVRSSSHAMTSCRNMCVCILERDHTDVKCVGRISPAMTSCWSTRALTLGKNHTAVRYATSSFHRGRAWTDTLGHIRGRGLLSARCAPSASHYGNTSRDIPVFVQLSRNKSSCMTSRNSHPSLCRVDQYLSCVQALQKEVINLLSQFSKPLYGCQLFHKVNTHAL